MTDWGARCSPCGCCTGCSPGPLSPAGSTCRCGLCSQGYRLAAVCSICLTSGSERGMPATEPRIRNRRTKPCAQGCGTLVGKDGSSCWLCYVKERASTSAKKNASARRAANAFLCSEGCGRMVPHADYICQGCKQARQYRIAASANKKIVTSRAMRSLENGTSFGIMLIGDDLWPLQWRCPASGCERPMLVNGRCYFHSTGRPVTLAYVPQIVRRSDLPQ